MSFGSHAETNPSLHVGPERSPSFDTSCGHIMFAEPRNLCLLQKSFAAQSCFSCVLAEQKHVCECDNAVEILLIYGQGVKFGARELKGLN